MPPLNRHAVAPGGLNKSGEPRGWGGTGGRYVAKDDVGKEVPVGTWCLIWATLRSHPSNGDKKIRYDAERRDAKDSERDGNIDISKVASEGATEKWQGSL